MRQQRKNRKKYEKSLYRLDSTLISHRDMVRRSMYSPNDNHISIARLWDFTRDPKSPTLQDDERNHLCTCEDCTAVLWLCHTSQSIDYFRRKVTEHGMSISQFSGLHTSRIPPAKNRQVGELALDVGGLAPVTPKLRKGR